MATVPRRLTFGAHADAYERARPAWPEEAARWLVTDDAQLVIEQSDRGRFAFRHALTRESVMSDLLEPERRSLHLRIAAAINLVRIDRWMAAQEQGRPVRRPRPLSRFGRLQKRKAS